MFSVRGWIMGGLRWQRRLAKAARRQRQLLLLEQLEDRLTPSGNIFAPTYVLKASSASDPAPDQTSGPSGGYTPDVIRTAYLINNTQFNGSMVDGTGETIAIVDAYNDPTIFTDLDEFDTDTSLTSGGPSIYSLYGAASTFLTVYNQNGQVINPATTTSPGTDPTASWEVEESLDVEWAHAIAPGAQIAFVEADDASDNLFTAVQTAASLPNVCAVSMSWGGGEGSDETSFDSIFTTPTGHQGVTFLASTGDDAAPAGYPAYSPNVVAVGGTSLFVTGADAWEEEDGWSDSGGGKSEYEAEPTYQDSVQHSGKREAPDVSFDADPDTGVDICDSYSNGAATPWEVVGGTSVASPCWAGLVTMADSMRADVGFDTYDGSTETLPQLYKIWSTEPSAYHDITSGNNGFACKVGYDLVTGIGSPVVNQLVPDLAAVGVYITPATIPAAQDGVAYSQQLTGNNGTGPYTFSIAGGTEANGLWTGGGLPTGMSLSSSGLLGGTPTEGGTFPFTIDVADSSSPTQLTGTRNVSLVVDAPTFVLAPATPDGLPTAQELVAYNSGAITVSGGTPTYTLELISTLPTGLTFTGTAITGTTDEYGTFPVTLSATDSSGSANGGHGPYTFDESYNLVVSPPAVVFSPATPPGLTTGTVAQPYSQYITATGGVPTYTYDIVSGSLPGGLFMNPSTGQLSGVPTDGGGPFDFVVAATDSSGTADGGDGPYTADQAYQLTINPPTLSLTPSSGSLTTGQVGVTYLQRLTAGNGTAPYAFALTTGSLPAGLTLSSTGSISGTPTVAGTSTFTITVTDSSGGIGAEAGPYSVSATYTLTISPPNLTISPTTLPAGQVGVAYSQQFVGAGSIAPYTFSYTGTLPSGLTLTSAGLLSGTPTQGGSFAITVKMTDSSAGSYSLTQSYTLTIQAPDLEFSPADLPLAADGQAYSEAVTLVGGTGPQSFSFVSGTLPAGLSFTNNGTSALLAGTPTEAGVFTFTLGGTDSSTDASNQPYTKDWTYQLTVNAPTIKLSPASLNVGQVGLSYSASLTPSGGTAPYTNFALSSGTLPLGLALSFSNGIATISGLPEKAGVFSFGVAVTDSSGGAEGAFTESQAFTLTIHAPTITLTPGSLPDARAGAVYSQTLTASGGIGPYSGFVITNGRLPFGLSLSTSGTISGTPTETGTFYFNVQVADSSAGGPYTGTTAFALTVDAPTITVTPPSLPAATAGASYSETLSAGGGTAPYSAFTVSAGSLPPGLSLSSSGTLSGTPTAVGTFDFALSAQDSTTGQGPYTGSTPYVFTVNAPTITVTPASVPAATVGASYSETLSATGGTAPYSNFALTASSGPLPAGLTLSTAGVISGTPTAGGTFTFTVQAQDSTTGTGSPFLGTRQYTLVVGAPTITLGPASLTGGVVGSSYSANLTASGGTAPYTNFTITGGSLPAGLSLATNGSLTGSPTATGTYTFTVQAQDASTGTGPYTGTGSYQLTIARPTIVVTPATLPTPTVGVSYDQTLSATGGIAPYGNFTVVSGALPTGLALTSAGVLSGIPTAGGSFTFTVQATDSTGGTGPYSGTTTYTVAVNPPSLQLTPSSLPSATVGTAYTVPLSTVGGTAPYHYTLASGSSLPTGLTLSSSGSITGTPTEGGNFSFTITTTDSSGGTGPYSTQLQYALVVATPTITITPLTLPAPTVGQAYQVTLAGQGGTAPYTFSLANGGKLPAGLTLTSAGMLSGTPTAGGTYSFTVDAVDASGGTGPYSGTGNFTLQLNAANIVISPTTLTSAQVGTAYTQTLTVSGGTAPYSRFTLSAGSLPGGLTLSPAGVISGIPTGGGTFQFSVSVQDSSGGSAGPYTGTANETLTVTPPNLVISPSALPSGTLYQTYNQTLSASGGTAPYNNFVVVSGTLPTGLALTSGGTLVGTAKVAGTFNFTVQVTDSSSKGGPFTGTRAYAVVINTPTIVVTPSTLSAGTVGTAYSQTLLASGGLAPYVNFSVVAGALPAGLTLSSVGTLSGIPTAGGVFNFTIDATDSSAGPGPYTGGTSYALTVNGPTITLSPSTLPGATVGVGYQATLSASGGTAPYSNFHVTSGSLPAGLSLSTAGVLTGTPTAGGSFTFTIGVSDSSTGTGAPYTGSATYTLAVAAPTITLNPGSLVTATDGVAYNQQLYAAGGIAPYTHFAVTSGALPAGLQLSSSGLLSGTPSALGSFSFTIAAQDSSTGTGPFTGSVSYSLTVNPPTIIISPGQLTAGTVGVPYSATLTASGGTAPYSGYTVSAGTLPAGLTLASNGTLTGTPTAGGSFSFTVTATDSTSAAESVTGSSVISLTVNAPTISVSPAALPPALLEIPLTDTVSASGGTPAYGYAVVSGQLPPGVTLGTNGTLTGAPTATGVYTFTIQATDASTGTGPYSATQLYSLNVGTPTVTLSPSATPAAQVGVAYSETFSASGANAPYTYRVSAGSLPAGLQLTSAGVLSGTPTAGGTFTFTVKATDASAVPFTATRQYTLTVAPPTLALNVALGSAQVAVPYSAQFTLTGGTSPGRFVLLHSTLPAGLHFASNGVLSGTPIAGGTFSFTIEALDASTGTGPYSLTQQYSLTIAPPNLVITTQSLPPAQVGNAYKQTIVASGGTGPLHYSLASGTLPTGITLNATTGTLAGTSKVGGSYSFVVKVTDASSGTGPYSTQQNLTLIVQQPASITFSAPLSGTTSGAVNTFAVSVVDQFGNPYDGPVTIIAVLKGSKTAVPLVAGSVTKVTAVNGIATFSDVAINTILVGGKGAQQFEIIATAGGSSATSNAFTAGTGGRLN